MPIASSPAVSCGAIGGAVSNVTFSIAAEDRVAKKSAVKATFTFTPSAGGAGASAVTLNYPSGFFATSPTPTASVSAESTSMTPGPPGATSIVLTVAGTAALAAGTAVTVTLHGCTMGVAMAATDSVTVQTDRDPAFSIPFVSSGWIGGQVTWCS